LSSKRALTALETGDVRLFTLRDEARFPLRLEKEKIAHAAIAFDVDVLGEEMAATLTLVSTGSISASRKAQNLHVVDYSANQEETVEISVRGTEGLSLGLAIWTE
jgi:hypothetical protein